MLNPLEITDFSKFETGLRPLFELLKNASDEEKLNDLITKDETFTRVDVETVAAINLFAGTDIKYDEKEDVVNMCKAWDGAMQMYADEARAATRKEMKKEMKKEMRRQAREKDRRTVFNMFSRGYSQKEIAAISELPLKKVQKMCEGFIENTTMAVHTS